MKFYYLPVSAPCRAVMLLFQAINMKPDMQLVQLEKGENLTPEYLKMNPQHTIPVIDDNGYVLSESRAILGYVAEKYAMDMMLYPSEPMARGVVNQRLYFDIGTLYQKALETYMFPFINGEGRVNMAAYKKLEEAFGFLDTFMGNARYMAGDRMTVADFSIMATVSSVEQVGFDLAPYAKVMDWYNRMKTEMPGYKEANAVGAEMWGSMIKNGLNLK